MRLKVSKDLLPLVLTPTVIQQIRFNEVHIQESRKLRTVGGYGVVLQRKGCCLLLRFFVRIITVDAEALACFGVIHGSAVVGKAVRLHRPGNIALRRGLRFFQCLIVQLIVKAVFNMVIGRNLIGRGHLRGVAVNGFCGQPFRFFWEGVIQLPHFFDLRVNAACPQVLFTPATSAEEVVAVGAQTVQQRVVPAAIRRVPASQLGIGLAQKFLMQPGMECGHIVIELGKPQIAAFADDAPDRLRPLQECVLPV